MGFWDFLQNVGKTPVADPNVSYAMFEPRVEYLGSLEWEERIREQINDVRGMNASQMWRTQPQLRTVVGFVARNIAQLGVHVFERVSDTDRKRDRANDFARALANPGDKMTTYDLIFALVGDKMLYDRAYWLPYTDKEGKPRIRRLPPSWVSPLARDAFGIKTYTIAYPGGTTELPAERLIEFTGYSPSSVTGCSPPIEALKDTLVEMIQSTLYRAQVWKRGGRVSSVISRPANAPAWTDTQADRFRDDWYASYTGDGDRAGGTPILEDGMTINKLDLSAEQQQWAEGVKLSLVTVASVYYVNPTMIGLLDNANFSNVREFRRALYGDTLGPYIADLEGVFNTFALPFYKMDNERFYAELNIAEKLQGSFEEQATVLSTATGAPYMTRNEARAKQNLPAIEGGDELVIPLNVLVGGQASPRDAGTQNEDPTADDPDQAKERLVAQGDRGVPVTPLSVKARADKPFESKAEQVVRDFFKRQERVVRAKLGTKDSEDWWDEERWNTELSNDLYALALLITGEVATKTLEGIGFSPDEFDSDRTMAWLREVSDRSASSLNEGTKTRLAEALSGDAPDEDVDAVFASQDSHATMVAVSTVTLLSGFATTEAAKQVAGDKATKTWITGKNARPDHAALDGETVLLSENFSNGAAWPGDGGALGAEDLANCNCELQIDVP
jgi:HK97 family phage portal protein